MATVWRFYMVSVRNNPIALGIIVHCVVKRVSVISFVLLALLFWFNAGFVRIEDGSMQKVVVHRYSSV